VYAGHAALALALKSRRPATPMLPLLLACYGPDWVDMALMIPTPRAGMAEYSHSLPALALGALVAGGLVAVSATKPAGLVVAFGWLMHWPLDLFTGRKPVFGTLPQIGLDLYHMPAADFVLETVVIASACTLYGRAFAPERPHRRIVIAVAAALVALQLGFDLGVHRLDGQPWNPSFALGK